VTGVAGFIGSNIAEILIESGQQVNGIDNLSTGNKDNIETFLNKENFNFIEGDITELDLCYEAINKCDFVLHQAALGSIPRSIDDPLRTNAANIDGFLNMLVAAKDSNVRRFIYAGSSSTYGDHQSLPKKEDIIGKPLSPYSITKYVNELYAETFNRHYGIDTIGLRYFNVFGRRQRKDGAYAAVIPTWIMALLRKEQVKIFGDGDTSRDFCYIDNVIQANLLAAFTDNEKAFNQVFNVAVSDETSLNELFELISMSIKRLDASIEISPPIHQDFRAGDMRHSRADITKAKELLNYNPSHKIAEGIDETVSWYIDKIK
tara:strand:+ start:511 stop:1464 length:954 start_codon:yes stop_codon:yes gene_type:complete